MDISQTLFIEDKKLMKVSNNNNFTGTKESLLACLSRYSGDKKDLQGNIEDYSKNKKVSWKAVSQDLQGNIGDTETGELNLDEEEVQDEIYAIEEIWKQMAQYPSYIEPVNGGVIVCHEEYKFFSLYHFDPLELKGMMNKNCTAKPLVFSKSSIILFPQNNLLECANLLEGKILWSLVFPSKILSLDAVENIAFVAKTMEKDFLLSLAKGEEIMRVDYFYFIKE